MTALSLRCEKPAAWARRMAAMTSAAEEFERVVAAKRGWSMASREKVMRERPADFQAVRLSVVQSEPLVVRAISSG